MRPATLDRRVRNEARGLVREARALAAHRELGGKADELARAADEVARGLAEADLGRVRRGLPALDALVDELGARAAKSMTRDYVESIGVAILVALALRAFVVEAFKIPSSSMYPTLEIGDHIFVNKFLYGLRIPWTDIKLFARSPARGEVIVFEQPCEPERDYIKRVVGIAGDTVEVRCNVVYVNGTALASELVQGDGCEHEDYDEDERRWFTRACSRYRETAAGLAYQTFHDPGRPDRERRPVDAHWAERAENRDFPQLDRRLPPRCPTHPDGEPLVAKTQLPGRVVETRPDLRSTPSCEPQLHYVVPDGHVFVMGDNRANSNDSRVWGAVPIDHVKGKALFTWLSYRAWSPLDWSQIRFGRIGSFVH